MGETTAIEWADHTFNAFLGCTEVSAACDFCYAKSWAKRTGNGHLWQGERRRTSEWNWSQPFKWDRAAGKAGERRRVFCCSLADVFDNQIPTEWRDDLWCLIADTPNLDWLLLTKRPQNIRKMLPGAAVEKTLGRKIPWPWPNVWLGTTTEDQAEANRRIPYLLHIDAVVHFISYEPALGPIDFCSLDLGNGALFDSLRGFDLWSDGTVREIGKNRIGWIIAGGESGPHARMPRPEWFRGALHQCAVAKVPFLFKQWGNFVPDPGHSDSLGEIKMRRAVSKKVAGRLLDGQTYDGFPDTGR